MISENTNLVDAWGRSFKTLRVSLTGHCNLACTYCVSDLKSKVVSKKEQPLSVDELVTVISSLNKINPLDTIRLTGGEPLLFKNIDQLIQKLIDQTGVRVKLTTNGVYLKDKIPVLKSSGIDSINISLDTLDEENFFKMTRRRDLFKVLEGIEAAVQADLPVKINMVVMKNANEEDIIPMLEYAFSLGVVVRFLEVMPMGHLHGDFENYYVSEKEILKRIEEVNPVYSLDRGTSATANYWMGVRTGTFGIISNISNPFCGDCNRLRLDSMGNIFGCLSVNNGFNIRNIVQNEEALVHVLRKALAQKQSVFKGSDLSMKAIGG